MRIIRKVLVPTAVISFSLLATGTPTAFAASDTSQPVEDQVVQIDIAEIYPTDLASRFIGSEIYTADSQKVGDISDLILDENYRIVAVTVGVGGFLGIDETSISVPISHLTINFFGDDDSHKLNIKTDLTKTEIEEVTK